LLGKTNYLRDYTFALHNPLFGACDGRYKYIRNLNPGNTLWIEAIHGAPVYQSWEADAKHDPKLAERLHSLLHPPGEALFDLSNDPYEMKNLAENPEYAGSKARLAKALDAWMAQQGFKGVRAESDLQKQQGKGDQSGEAKSPKAERKQRRATKSE